MPLIREPNLPADSAPRTKKTSAITEDSTEKPLTPAMAKATNTTFPVILATNT